MRKDDVLFPVLFATCDALKVKLPAMRLLKFRFKSTAIEVLLSVPPVARKTRLVEDATFCPIAVPVATVAGVAGVATVVLVAAGTVPVADTATVLQLVGQVAFIAVKGWL